MNHIYRLIWDRTLGALVPVAEITRSKRGGPVRRVGAVGHRRAPLATALALALGLAPGVTLARAPLAQASLSPSDLTLAARSAVVGSQGIVPPPSHPLPTGGQVVGGSATIGQHDTTLTVDQSSQSAIIDWQSFDIGAGYTVTFHQPNASSVALNRVLGTDPSAIYGHLNANGQVFLVNPYGVYFAPGAQVDVGGLVASTLDISNPDFLAGRYRFSGSSTAGVRNDGRITATNGGYVAFIGPQVENTGSITTPGGTTALGAGSRVNLTLAGHGLVSFQVDGKALNALAQNGGLIAADGGRVILTAQARDALLRTVVNNTGRIQAQTVANHDGTITLLGGDSGTVQVAGTLDASAPNGGDGGAIDTSGAHVKIADSAVITTHAAAGADGSWLIDPQDFTIAAAGGDMTGATLSTALASGNVTIQSTTGGTSGNGDIFVDDTVSWSSNTLTLNAYRDIVVNATMNGSGSAGLALEYGQGSSGGSVGDGYTVNAPINLTSAGSFSTKLGTAGSVVNYTIIDSLGAAGSTTGTDLQGINGDPTGHYVLGADIDASATAGWNTNTGFTPIGPNTANRFTGIFDGLGHTISGLTINRPSIDNVGLFGFIGGYGTLRNVGVLGGSMAGRNNVGALAGNVNSGAGGPIISNVYATSDVSGQQYVGGLAGFLYATHLSNAFASGNVSGTLDVGGLVGNASGSCTVSDVYATGNVHGTSNNIGGLIGISSSTTISNAYATGGVSNSGSGSYIYTGALIGLQVGGSVTHGYWNTTTAGLSAGIGTNIGAPFSGGGLTTAQLAAGLPTGFDSSVWANAGNQTTPYLLAHAGLDSVGGHVILGSDSSATPTYYDVIQTLDQLQNINSTGLAGHYVLGNDIDASATASWNGGAGFDPIGSSTNAFTGVFDGLGHTISSLAIYRLTTDDVGLFGYTSGRLSNIGLVGGTVAGRNFVGALAGRNDDAIDNAYADTHVSGNGAIGGLVGANISSGSISHAHAFGDVTGSTSNIGGLVGYNADNSTISDAYATGTVNGGTFVGGLVGENINSTISNTYATGSVNGTSRVGGLVGVNNFASLTNSYATGNVTGDSLAGGLVGSNFDSSLSDAYATGNVTGTSNLGGLAGSNYASSISDVYATGDVTGTSNVGGLVGFNAGTSVTLGTITNAYATGGVSGSLHAGGLVGLNSNFGSITNGYWDTTTGLGVGIGSNLGALAGSSGLTTTQLAAALPTGFSSSTWANGADSSGTGQTTPYLLANASFDTVGGHVILGSDASATPTFFEVIQTLDQLQAINSTGLAGDYVLGNDIDASATAGWNGGAGFVPIGSNASNVFGGVFDGLGHSISGLTVNRPSLDEVGLFGDVQYGTVRNIGLLGGGVTGRNAVGALVGYTSNSTISNAFASTDVSGQYAVGGLVGSNSNGSITDVHASGSVTGVSYGVGGLVGENYAGGSISNAYASGSVNGTNAVGGLVGSNYGNSVITDAYATGNVSGSGSNAGGLVGYNDNGTITNAYATGNVSGNLYVGGLVGASTNSGAITDVYATGSVSGSVDVGGLVGVNTASTITNGYWDTTTGLSTGIGSNFGTLTGGGGLTTAQLAAALPTGFDSATWANGADSSGTGQTTPYLLANASFDTVGGHVILGSDSSATPAYYDVIQTLDQLQAINSTGLAGDYVLGNDIDASATAGWNGGAGFMPIGNANVAAFTGVFDGLSHIISGLTINRPTTDYVGLFGRVQGGGTLRNVGLEGGSVTGQDQVGGLLGQASSGTATISHAYNTGNVNGRDYVGGLIGSSTNALISDSHASGNVNATDYVTGGLVGYVDGGSVTRSYATGSVSGLAAVGGLLGTNSNGTVSKSYATGNVNGTVAVGGLVGFNYYGTISDAYATGSVSGTQYVGGLVGSNAFSSINNAYATGNVSGTSEVGGLIGTNIQAITSNTYATGSVSGSTHVGGLVGLNTSTSSITNGYWDITTTGQSVGIGSNLGSVTGGGGLTSTQMMQQASFTGFDFSSPTWVIYEGHTAPLLNAFLTDLTVTASDQTQTYSGGTFGLAGATYSVAGADSSGHLFGLSDAYDGASDVGTYAPDLWSDQQGYRIITLVGGALTIDPKALTLSGLTADDKVYDGTTAATIGSFGSLIGLVSGDSVSLTSGSSASFADANAGTGKTVTVSGLALGGTDAGNYTLVGTAFTTADITPRTLSVSLIGNPTKDYDGTTLATLDPSNFQLSGFVSGQGASIDATIGAYASADPGSDLAVSATLSAGDYLADSGTLLSNYSLPTTASGFGTILAASGGTDSNTTLIPGLAGAIASAQWSAAWGYTGIDRFSARLDPRLGVSLRLPGKTTAVRLAIRNEGGAPTWSSRCAVSVVLDPFLAGQDPCRQQ